MARQRITVTDNGVTLLIEPDVVQPLGLHNGDEADVVVCAATYAYHLTQAHAFVDGNKRVAMELGKNHADFDTMC